MNFFADAGRIEQTLEVGRKLLDEFGLADWTIELDNSVSRVGQCRHDGKEIGISVYYLEKSTWEEIEDTIRHEIAHALVGPRHGHDYTWKLKCIEVGAKPERLAGEDAVSSALPRYRIKCNNCGKTWDRHRLNAGYTNGRFRSGCCRAEMTVYVRHIRK